MLTVSVQAKSHKIEGVFRQAMVGTVGSLDPIGHLNEIEMRILENMQDTLLSIDPATGNVTLNAAASYDVSADGLTITFTLKDHLYYSNGKPVTSKDYAFALRRHLNPKNKSAYASTVSYIQGGLEMMEGMFYHPDKIGIQTSVDKGKQSLKITLVRPYPKILYFFAHAASMPIHEESFEKLGSSYFELGNMHASGPFIGVKKNASLFVFAKNPHHRDQKSISLRQVQLSLFDSDKSAQKAFLKGRVDQFGSRQHPVGPQVIQSLKGSDVLFFQPDLRTMFIRFHTRRVPTGQYKIRQALSMAIDRQEIQKLALTASERTSFAITPDQQHLYDPPHAYYNDMQGAKNILRQLGFCLDEVDRSKCLELPVLEIMFPKTLLAQKVVVLIKSQWEKLGFTSITLTGVRVSKFVENINHGLFTIALDEIAVDTYNFFDLLHSFESSQLTSVGVQSNQYDEILQSASHAMLLQDSIARYRQAESYLLREASIIPLVQTTFAFAKAIYVKGYEPNLWDVHPWSKISIQ